MEELTPKSDGNGYEQGSTSNHASPLISEGRERVNISIPEEASIEVNIEAEISQSWERRIEKVAAFLRRVEHNKCDYDPAAVSLGPYHHGKPELKLVEDFKPKSLELFAAGCGKDTDFFYKIVLEVIQDVRRCYVENSTDEYNDAVFARMMLHDACFLINIIDVCVCVQQNILEAVIGHLGKLVLSLICRDVFLLENQIPFWFLKLLICLKYGEDACEEILRIYLNIWVNNGKFEQTRESNEEEEEPLHLLEACRRILASHSSKDEKPNRCSIFEWLSSQSATIGDACQRHCFSKFQWLWKREKINRGFDFKKYVHSFRSVTDLKAKGIHFRCSPTDSFKDIKFKSSYLYGKLQLPTWIVNKNTKVFFLNVIAFEMCPNSYTDLTVSTYINFMKSLIESSKDVKELREKKIIFNMLGSDEEVLQVFKDINTYGVDDSGMFYEVKQKIQEHYNSKAKTWVAELIHTYFSSPWTAIALLAAIFLLCLTLVQTYFTIHPSSDK